MWPCSNCDVRVDNVGTGSCKRCGGPPPGWVRLGLLQSEHTIERQQLYGNDTRALRKKSARERAAFEKSQLEAAGKGDYEKLRARNAELEAELKKHKAKNGDPAAAAAGAAPDAATTPVPGGEDDVAMEEDSFKANQAAARAAEEQVKRLQDTMDSMANNVFPDGVEDEAELQKHEETRGWYGKLQRAKAERDLARERVRGSRPLAAQILNLQQNLAKKEAQVEGNVQKAKDFEAAAKVLEKSLEENQQQAAALGETTRNQQAKVAQWKGELVELRKRQLEEEGGAPPPPAPPPAAVPDAMEAAMFERLLAEPAFLRSALERVLSDPGGRVDTRRALEHIEAKLEADCKNRVAEEAAAAAANAAAAQSAAAAARMAADAAKASETRAPLPRAPRDYTRLEGAKERERQRGRAESPGAESVRSRSRSADSARAASVRPEGAVDGTA